MRIAILNAQTDASDYAGRFPDDGEKFAALLRAARPGWDYEVHQVHAGQFPADALAAEGALITGSIASANDADPWIARLADLVRARAEAGRALYGACFGHQIIARALGGRVGPNPEGWRLGVARTDHAEPLSWMAPPQRVVHLHAAHSEQVLDLPRGAGVIGSSPATPVAAMTWRRHVAGTQYHPEMSADFLSGLLPLLAGHGLPEAALATARKEIGTPVDNALMGRWIAGFFEAAQG